MLLVYPIRLRFIIHNHMFMEYFMDWLNPIRQQANLCMDKQLILCFNMVLMYDNNQLLIMNYLLFFILLHFNNLIYFNLHIIFPYKQHMDYYNYYFQVYFIHLHKLHLRLMSNLLMVQLIYLLQHFYLWHQLNYPYVVSY